MVAKSGSDASAGAPVPDRFSGPITMPSAGPDLTNQCRSGPTGSSSPPESIERGRDRCDHRPLQRRFPYVEAWRQFQRLAPDRAEVGRV